VSCAAVTITMGTPASCRCRSTWSISVRIWYVKGLRRVVQVERMRGEESSKSPSSTRKVPIYCPHLESHLDQEIHGGNEKMKTIL
jgi:hypothetical protein